MPRRPVPPARGLLPRAAFTTACTAAFTVACTAGPTAAAAFADDRDDRIRALERLVHDQTAEQARLREEVEAMKRDRADGPTDRNALRDAVDSLLREVPSEDGVAVGDARRRAALRSGPDVGSSLDFGGYFSTRFLNSELPGKKPSFVDMRFVLQTRAEISRAVRFDGELELEHGGVSDETDGEVKVEYAQITLSDSECFGFKAGSLLTPWGRFNQQHDDPLNELSSRPTVSRFVHGAVMAGPGVGAEGVLAASDDLSLNYDVVLTNGLADTFSSGDGIREARTLWEDDDNHDKTVFGRFGAVPQVGFVDSLDVGASFAWGRLGEKADDAMRGYGLDVAARSGAWEFKGEWAHLGVDRRNAAPPIDALGRLGPVRGLGGSYGQVVYRIREAWVKGLPFAEESASVGLVARYDAVDTNDRIRGAAPEDDERAFTLGVNYRPTTKTVIKFEVRFAESEFPGDDGSRRDLVVLEFATYF
ncbi:MAG: hypothetical protein K8T90_14065 [Planctomycetes bacterium]|nr:hypothetical protein [Planctomycetota bacterium]